MLGYEEFKELVIRDLPKCFSKKFGDLEIKEAIVYDINTARQVYVLKGLDEKIHEVDFSLLYHFYYKNGDIEEALTKAMALFSAERAIEIEKKEHQDINCLKEQVVFQFIHAKQNENLLKELVHQDFLDLAIVFRWKYGSNSAHSMLLSKKQVAELGVSEKELFEWAKINTRKMYPLRVEELSLKEATEVREEEYINLKNVTENTQIVLSNIERNHGAIAILYDEILDVIAQKMKSDLFLIPLSMHEMICASASGKKTAEEWSEELYNTNIKHLAIRERLSNQIYKYDRKSREITCVTEAEHIYLDDPTPEDETSKFLAEIDSPRKESAQEDTYEHLKYYIIVGKKLEDFVFSKNEAMAIIDSAIEQFRKKKRRRWRGKVYITVSNKKVKYRSWVRNVLFMIFWIIILGLARLF